METKKTEKADLSNKSWFFFNIGLAVTLLIVLMAFEYNNSDNNGDTDLNRSANVFEDEIEVPPVDIPPPPPPKIQQPEIIEVKDDEKIEEEIKVEFDVEVTEDTKVEDIVVAPIEEPKEDFDQVFTIVEENTQPVGGMSAFYKFLGDNLKYPAQARRMNIDGKVFMQFVVERDGSLTDIKVIKGIGAGCDEEAIRVLQKSPKWKPGKQRGRAVRQIMNLPIVFTLK